MATTVATARDFWRLAEEAERRGIRVLVEPISGEHFATSATDPTRLYRVTGFSCTCKGYIAWQRCTHYSLLLAELGWLPDPEPDPTPPAPAAPPAAAAPVPCPGCDAAGRVLAYYGPEDGPDWAACGLCGGEGEVDPARLAEPDGDTSRHDAPYDQGRRPVPTCPTRRRNRFNLTDEELVLANGQAFRLHVERGWPLVDPETGEVLSPAA